MARKKTPESAEVSWEYHDAYFTTIPGVLEGQETLNLDAMRREMTTLGLEGWELVSSVPSQTGVRHFFKRFRACPSVKPPQTEKP